MAILKINLPEGGEAQVPDWMVDQNLNNILAQLKSMSGMDKNHQKLLDEILKKHTETIKQNNVNNTNTQTELKNLNKNMNYESRRRRGLLSGIENFFLTTGFALGRVLSGAITASVGALTIFSGILLTRAGQLGDAFNELTKQGVARGDAQGETIDLQILKLNALGLSTESAVQAIMENSRVFATASGAANNVIDQFDKIVASGIDLGMTFGDATSAAADEISQRQMLLNVNNLGLAQQTQLSQQVATTISNQIKYSQALGESIDSLSTFADSITSNNGFLTASLLRFDDAVRNDMLNGVRNFAIAMRGLGGEGGGSIAEAVVEAMTGGAIGFSDMAVDMIAVLPRLGGTFNELIKDFQAGTLDGAEAAEAMAGELGNLTARERDRIFMLARAGDQTARAMAQTIVAFEQSAKRLTEQGFQTSEQQSIQKGFNLINTIMSQLRGTIDFLINSVVFLIGDLDFLKDSVAAGVEGFRDFRISLRNVLYSMLGYETTTEGLVQKGSKLEGVFKDMPEKIKNWFEKTTAYFTAVAENIQDGIKEEGGIWNYLNKSFKEGWNNLFGENGYLRKKMDQAFGEEGWFTQWWQNTGKPAITSAWEKIVGWFKEAYNYLVGVFNPTDEETTVVEPTGPGDPNDPNFVGPPDPNYTPPVEPPAESSEVEASKPFLTRMSEKIFQGMVNVLGTPEAQAQFYVLGQSMAAGIINSLTNLRMTIPEVNAGFKIPGLLYGDYEGNFKIDGTTFQPFTSVKPAGGSSADPVLPFMPPEQLNSDEELKQLLKQYFEQQQATVDANGQAGTGAMPELVTLADVLEELKKHKQELERIKGNTKETNNLLPKLQ